MEQIKVERKLIKLKKDGKEVAKEMNMEEVYIQYKNYIYKSCQSWINQYDFDDVHQVAYYGLHKAFNTYDAGKGILFLTYAARIILNEILMFHRKQGKHSAVGYLDSPIAGDADGGDLMLSEIVADDSNFEEEIIKREQAREAMQIINSLKPRDKIIVTEIIFKGKTQYDLAVELNLSQSYISRLYKRITSGIKKTINRLDKADESKGLIKIKRNTMKIINERVEEINMPKRGDSKLTKENLLKEVKVLGATIESARIIAKKYGLSENTVATYFTRFGIKEELGIDRNPENRAKITKEQLLEEAKILGVSKTAAAIIGDKYGLDKLTIIAYFRKFDIKGKLAEINNKNNKESEGEKFVDMNPTQPTPITEELLLKEAKILGTSEIAAEMIADKYNFSKSRVIYYLNAFNIEKKLLKAKEIEESKEIKTPGINENFTGLKDTTVASFEERSFIMHEADEVIDTRKEKQVSSVSIASGDATKFNLSDNIQSPRLKCILKGAVAEYEILDKLIDVESNGQTLTLKKKDLFDFIEELKELYKLI